MASGRGKSKKKNTSSSNSSSKCPFGRKNRDILRALYHLTTDQRSALLRKADLKLVRHICECALNLLRGGIPLNKRQRSSLRKHVKLLRQLADPSRRLPIKKRIIVQKGGGAFLTALLAPLIGTVLSNFVARG